jgi:hypothetical protein
MTWMRALVGTTVDDMSSLGWGIGEESQVSAHEEPVIWLSGRRGAPPPPWADAVVSRIVELARLETVDPRIGRPLNGDDVIAALRFLDRIMREDTCPPWIGRLSSGGVELVWRHEDVEAEAVFDQLRGESELVVEVGDNEWDAPADQADSLFATVVDRLSNSYIEHTAAASAAV